MAHALPPHVRHFLLALALVTLACAVPGALQPTPRPASAPTPLAGATPRSLATAATSPFSGEAELAAVEGLPTTNLFAPFRPVPASIINPGLPRSELADMQKLESLQQLGADQQEMLLANGFVVEPRPFNTFAAAYAAGAEQKLPAFITTDVILHAFYVVADIAWQRSEANFLRADLQALSHNMVAVSEQQWQAAQDDATAQAAQRNLAFFAVGSSLLDPDFTPPSLVAQVVTEERTLIAQGGRFISPLFDIEEDYSRFIPRGRYAQDEALQRYFQALTWFSKPFSFSYAPEGNNTFEPLARARLSARQVLLMTWGLQDSDNMTRWQRVFEPTLFFQGATVAWSITQIQTAAAAVYGPDPALAALDDDDLLDDFLATMHTMPPSLPFHPQPQPAFALLPQPADDGSAAPDAPVMQQLVFNRVGAYVGAESSLPATAVQTTIGPIRGLPRTLDVAAALGSSLAETEINTAGDAGYEGYTLQLQQLQQHYAAIEPAVWTTSFDGAWLYTLQPLLSPVDDGFLYAPSDAWQARQLGAWHAAWLALRHDIELLPRPVAAIAVSPEVAYGYLEPQPLLYGRLASLAGQILDGLGSRNLLDEESAGKLQQLERLLDAARTISRKQAAAQRLTADEALLLSQFITRLQNLTTYEPAPTSAVPRRDANLPQLVDVHLEPSTGKLLQAASGDIWPIYLLVPREQGIILTMGAVLSSYELHGEQLSMQTWRDLEEKPPPPSWLQPYITTPGELDN